ncbi:MAG: alpha/beta fold hydrolase [Arcicella sp.]|jgi:predicted alpha/beta hydrolase|nr:alpha/beta fold hydrolase [Arcicella sp.]
MKQSKIKIVCSDGVALSAILLMPENQAKAVVQINSATATPKEYYLAFAQYLAENGFVVCVFDYRGVCESTPTGGLRGCTYDYLMWGQLDMPAVLDYLDTLFPDLPKLIMGHSVGGQEVGLMPNHHKIKGMVTYATSVGYWNFMPLSYRLQTHFFFQIFTPISNLLFGYVAAKRLGLMEDLPKQIVLDWRNWCSVPEYFFNEKYYAESAQKGFYKELAFPIKVYWTTDDPISNVRSVPMFWKHVNSTGGIHIESITPQEIGEKEIGHFGFFRKKFKQTLWTKALEDLKNFIQ